MLHTGLIIVVVALGSHTQVVQLEASLVEDSVVPAPNKNKGGSQSAYHVTMILPFLAQRLFLIQIS